MHVADWAKSVGLIATLINAGMPLMQLGCGESPGGTFLKVAIGAPIINNTNRSGAYLIVSPGRHLVSLHSKRGAKELP